MLKQRFPPCISQAQLHSVIPASSTHPSVAQVGGTCSQYTLGFCPPLLASHSSTSLQHGLSIVYNSCQGKAASAWTRHWLHSFWMELIPSCIGSPHACGDKKCALMAGAPLPSLLFLILFISSSLVWFFFFFFCIFLNTFSQRYQLGWQAQLCVWWVHCRADWKRLCQAGGSPWHTCSLPTLLSKPCQKYPIHESINRNKGT